MLDVLAIAAGLALGRSVPDATRDAKSFVLAALASAANWHLGEGRGPIDHLGWVSEWMFPRCPPRRDRL